MKTAFTICGSFCKIEMIISPAFCPEGYSGREAGKVVVSDRKISAADRLREADMYIIAGLGNPGKNYAHTRHNAGFDVIDLLADRYDIRMDTKKHKAVCGKGIIEGQRVVLAKPQTFMNLSGESIRVLVDFYKEDPEENLIVIYDDISLEPGNLRIRAKGSAGGHNGIKSVIAHLNTQVFKRIKIGVGEKPKGRDLADYVLGHFSRQERQVMEDALERAADAVVCILTKGMDQAMNEYNRKAESAK